MMKPLISIVTPTFNRAKTLPALFVSLQKQASKNFEWLIIDDGSQDQTSEVVKSFYNKDFTIKYLKKENGGKHTALNRVFSEIQTELTFIVDSDDVLTVDATAEIEKDWNMYRNQNLCGISYLRGYSENNPIGDLFPKDYVVDNFISLRFNKHINGDKAEVWVSKYLKAHLYPVFEGEIFFGESYLWIKLAKERDMLFRNKIIYITEYLEAGLSRSGRALRIKCPKGGMTNALMMMSSDFKIEQRIKGAILYSCYSCFAKQTFKDTVNNPYFLLTLLCYPLGIFLYRYWRKYL